MREEQLDWSQSKIFLSLKIIYIDSDVDSSNIRHLKYHKYKNNVEKVVAQDLIFTLGATGEIGATGATGATGYVNASANITSSPTTKTQSLCVGPEGWFTSLLRIHLSWRLLDQAVMLTQACCEVMMPETLSPLGGLHSQQFVTRIRPTWGISNLRTEHRYEILTSHL